MHALATCLARYVEQHFVNALTRDAGASLRPVLVGPPHAALLELFALLTSTGQREWELDIAGTRRDVIVLLVDDGLQQGGCGLSRGCNWDYAVSVRNSCPLVLILAARTSWDSRPESLANTTETIGELATREGRAEDALQAHLAGCVASQVGLTLPATRELLRKVREESARLDPASRDAMAWEVMERLLNAHPGNAAVDTACRAAGVPVIGNSPATFRDSYGVLAALGKFVSSTGLGEAVDQMKATTAAQSHGVRNDLDQLQAHLSGQLFSPTLLGTAPSRYYYVPGTTPSWYDALSVEILGDILGELEQGPAIDRLILSCTNAIPGLDPLRGGPFVVATGPRLQVRTSSGAQPPGIVLSRKVDRLAPVPIVPLQGDPMAAEDPSPPVHRKPIRYRVEAPNHRAGAVSVLSLDQFACGGLAVARGADRTWLPVHTARTDTWTQELALSRSGATELLVYHTSGIAEVRIVDASGSVESRPTTPEHHVVPLVIDLADNDRFEVVLVDQAGASAGNWTLVASIRELAEVATSRLDALVREHRTGRRHTPHAQDTFLHRLELSSYLGCADSWRPVLACWAGELPPHGVIDWAGGRSLGDVQPQIDPRPPVDPPQDLLEAREAVRQLLWIENRCTSEIEIDTPSLSMAIGNYLRTYRAWLETDPRTAPWLDVMALHVAEWNSQAGRNVATEEPVVALLSPLHPLRLAWHAVAQQELAGSLDHRCPSAGLLSPSHCPDSGLLHLWNGQEARPRAFLALPCEHPHWAVLMNATYLDRPATRSAALQALVDLGLQAQAMTAGFTAQQAEKSLDEVNRLLPARATLRIGIVGDAESSSECGTGVFRWSEHHLSQDAPTRPGCMRVDVFDTRGSTDPSSGQLADLSEISDERVRWFRVRPDSDTPKLDLTIIDQLGTRSPEAVPGTTRSPVAPGCLYRVRIREDFHDARAIVESRVAGTRLRGGELAVLLPETVELYETLCSLDSQRSHFRFTPNQDAVGSRLENATFLSLTSSQIDPACVVRGTAGQSGYIWDYELPGILGSGDSGLGYYLVARPTSAMCDAVERAASLVTSSPPSIPSLLEEVSRHGIPILKRLASGGSRSRGELGLLLSTRLLQDAFRPHPTHARLPVWAGNCIHLVLPVEPYEELFELLRRALPAAPGSAQRPDLVVVAIQLGGPGQPVSVKLTPVEVKFRAGGMPPGEMRDALGQANNLGKLFRALWTQPPVSELWGTCGSALLAQFLDFGFRIYAAEWLHGHSHGEWAAAHQSVVQDTLERSAHLTVNVAGRLIVFDGSPLTRVVDLDGDQRPDTLIVSQDDARALLGGLALADPTGDGAVPQLDFTFPECGAGLAAAEGAFEQESSRQVSLPSEGATAGPGLDGGEQQGTPGSAASSGEAPPEPGAPRVGGSTHAPSRVPPEVRQRVRAAFDGFVGNEPAVTRLSNDLLRALIERPPHLAKNYLFTGLPSTGKTELARRMARALELPFVKLDGRSVSSRDKLFDLVTGELTSHGLVASLVGEQVGLQVLEYPPLIVFIDEVHLVPRALQEALLTMLEAADRTVVLSSHVAHVHRATFLFATTRVSDVDAAFASRCDEIQLREYSEEEVAEILRWKLRLEDWPQSIFRAVARLGRCVPRNSIQLAEALETAILVAEAPKRLEEHLEDVRRAREIDGRGLTRMDFEYLAILERSGGPVGEQNMLNLMRTVDKDRVLNDIEPFLARLGFIRHGPRGRELTAEGREHLMAHRVAG